MRVNSAIYRHVKYHRYQQEHIAHDELSYNLLLLRILLPLTYPAVFKLSCVPISSKQKWNYRVNHWKPECISNKRAQVAINFCLLFHYCQIYQIGYQVYHNEAWHWKHRVKIRNNHAFRSIVHKFFDIDLSVQITQRWEKIGEAQHCNELKGESSQLLADKKHQKDEKGAQEWEENQAQVNID